MGIEGAAGDFVRIAVRDDGTGMSADVLARVFEPFFTTKPLGAGTGLGLSMVYGIVNQSGGFARIDSTPGLGTMVSVYLPLVREALTLEEAATEAPRGDGESILVVEDDLKVPGHATGADRFGPQRHRDAGHERPGSRAPYP